MSSGFTTLGTVAQRRSTLDVACNRCPRRGRLRVTRLIAEHGAALPIPELRRILAADCPKMIEGAMHDPCGIYFPGLGD